MIAEALSSVVDSIFSGRSSRRGQFEPWSTAYSTRETAAGVPMDPRRAESLSAYWCALRVISEGIAVLPLDIREHVNLRETRTAYDHKLWPILHDMPNPEMDKVMFFDTLVPLQVSWGDAYAEKQFDTEGGIVALWPIHYSRVRIVRGPVRGNDGGVAGADGGLVYMVRADDGTSYCLEANEILHVPGVASGNGITGKGLAVAGAEALGIISATEQHVGSYYRNGASPDIVITYKSAIPPEEKQNLRSSWSKQHTGPGNAHKMLLLGGDPTVAPFGTNPKDALLIDGRRFNVAEVSRITRVPLHFLAELERAVQTNVEALGIDFLTYALAMWIARWEAAMKRQLLKPEERQKYSFKFNVNALMRGDSAARSQFYMRLFDMGVFSINDILELEDRNPIEGGDRHFILANNRVPLDRIDDVATLNPRPTETGDVPPEDDPAVDPAAAVAAGEGVIDIQATALNGAQIMALLGMADKLSLGDLPKDGTRAMIQASFPSTDRDLIDTIVTDVSKWAEVRKKERAAAPRQPAKSDQSAMRSGRAAIQSVLATTLAGLSEYEARAVMQKVEQPGFSAWSVEFYGGKFVETFDSQVRPLVEGAAAFGATTTFTDLAVARVSGHGHQLRQLHESMQDKPMREFVERVQATVDEWVSEAPVAAALVFSLQKDSIND